MGLASYLLIGFWYEESFRVYAGRKAFVVNRIGDFGFILGIFLVFTTFGSLSYDEVLSGVSGISQATVTTIALLLFVGAVGKSAQFPLHVWLPDAMAGPTAVSALIHAATMVTAGVYMISRCSEFFIASAVASEVVLFTGAFTAFFAATIAVTQNDIKKVLAYSTVSQLGYMMMAAGAGAYVFSIFHLITHAFFKALSFLGGGKRYTRYVRRAGHTKNGWTQKDDSSNGSYVSCGDACNIWGSSSLPDFSAKTKYSLRSTTVVIRFSGLWD